MIAGNGLFNCVQLTLPPEIWAYIFGFFNRTQQWLPLCKVSRTFRAQAERELYHQASFYIYDSKNKPGVSKLLKWCSSITNNLRLAKLVGAIQLVVCVKSHIPRLAVVQTALAAVFQSVINLEHLDFAWSDISPPISDTLLAPWMFDNIKFRLKELHGWPLFYFSASGTSGPAD